MQYVRHKQHIISTYTYHLECNTNRNDTWYSFHRRVKMSDNTRSVAVVYTAVYTICHYLLSNISQTLEEKHAVTTDCQQKLYLLN